MENIKTREELKTSLKQEWTYWSTVLDSLLGQSIPAIESDFMVVIGNSNYSSYKEKYWTPRVAEYAYLYSVINATIPNLGYDFVNTPSGSGFIEGSISDGDGIVVTYWDTADQYFTRLIENLYLSQFTKYGTFRVGYRSSFMKIAIGTVTYVFECGAVTRPTPTGINASSNALTQYRFKFAYESAHVEYKNDIFDKSVADADELRMGI